MWFLHISPEYITRKYTKYIYNYYMHVILSFSKNVWFKGRSWWNVNMCETWCQDGPRRLAALWPETVGLFPIDFRWPIGLCKSFFCMFVCGNRLLSDNQYMYIPYTYTAHEAEKTLKGINSSHRLLHVQPASSCVLAPTVAALPWYAVIAIALSKTTRNWPS